MKIGILGSGDVAKALAAGFLRHGHPVMLGTRDRERLAPWLAQHPQATVGSVTEAAAFGELLVLAVKGSAATQVLDAAGAARLAGKTVIDTTNPIADAPPRNGVLEFFTGPNESLLERLQLAFRRTLRQGVQFGRQWPDGGPAAGRRPADHVHLRQRRAGAGDGGLAAGAVRLGRG